MAKKNSRNTKGRIISAAWKLFYEQGYEETDYSLVTYADKMTPLFLKSFRAEL